MPHNSAKNGPILKILCSNESLSKSLTARSGLGPVFSPTGLVWVLNPDFQKNRFFLHPYLRALKESENFYRFYLVQLIFHDLRNSGEIG